MAHLDRPRRAVITGASTGQSGSKRAEMLLADGESPSVSLGQSKASAFARRIMPSGSRLLNLLLLHVAIWCCSKAAPDAAKPNGNNQTTTSVKSDGDLEAAPGIGSLRALVVESHPAWKHTNDASFKSERNLKRLRSALLRIGRQMPQSMAAMIEAPSYGMRSYYDAYRRRHSPPRRYHHARQDSLGIGSSPDALVKAALLRRVVGGQRNNVDNVQQLTDGIVAALNRRGGGAPLIVPRTGFRDARLFNVGTLQGFLNNPVGKWCLTAIGSMFQV